MKGSKKQPKSLLPLAERKRGSKTYHSTTYYGIMYRGRLLGGIINPTFFTLEAAKGYPKLTKQCKIVKIRVTHEVVSEVIV